MKKTTIILIVTVFILSAGAFYFFNKPTSGQAQEQVVLDQTLTISQKYATLRYKTEDVLINVKNYANYDDWSKELTDIINDWKELEKEASNLEKITQKLTTRKTSFNLVSPVLAYTKEDITNIVDKAPAGKKIATLANLLGVDAKHAQLILNQTQDEISREAYGEEGDVFEKCEQNSMRIKNGSKVTVFVGGVILSGGTSAIAASGALAKTTLVVSGADLVLEVSDDEAKIALGDKNKVSEIVGSLRTVTEPAASILAIANMPGNLSKAVDQLSVISFGADQIRSVVQDKKILGISIKTDAGGEAKIEMAGLSEDELLQWREENNAIKSNESAEEIINNTKIVAEKETVKEKSNIKEGDNDNIAGSSWQGTLSSMSGGDNEKRTIDFDFTLNQDGSVNGSINGTSFKKWKQEGDRIKLYGEDESTEYYEFKVGNKDLLLTKIFIGGKLIQPGEEYMGGIAPGGFLKRKLDSKSENENPPSNKNAMSIAEYNEMDDKGMLLNISSVEKYLGTPDVKTTDDNGRIVYIYYDLVEYESGNLGSVKMTFYNEEDYKTYIKNMGASWESGKETWDESGGGITATSEIRSANTYKQQYGE